MNKFFVIFALTFCLAESSFAQLFRRHEYIPVDKPRYKVVYQYHYNKDSTNRDRISKRTMSLLIGDSVSFFVDEKLLWFESEMDKIQSVEQLQRWTYNNADKISSEDYKILKYNSGNKIVYWDYIVGMGHLKYEEKLSLNWEITVDTMTILGYTVQKALVSYRGRRWEAWFAPAIPLNNGPYKFMGLPGLILKMNDTKNYFVFEAISMENPKPEDFIGLQDENFINVTREKYLEMKRKFIEDFIKQPAADLIPDEQVRKTMAENLMLRRENNFIELK
ncbi:MAG: GLPGLI family protein [Bacteroidales bacterium]